MHISIHYICLWISVSQISPAKNVSTAHYWAKKLFKTFVEKPLRKFPGKTLNKNHFATWIYYHRQNEIFPKWIYSLNL